MYMYNIVENIYKGKHSTPVDIQAMTLRLYARSSHFCSEQINPENPYPSTPPSAHWNLIENLAKKAPWLQENGGWPASMHGLHNLSGSGIALGTIIIYYYYY